jgi:hypothetical protein
MKRLSNTQWLEPEQAIRLAVGNTIEGIEGLQITNVGEYKRGNNKNNGKPWTLQVLSVVKGRFKGEVHAWDFPDLSRLNKTMVNIESTEGRDGQPWGLRVGEYKGSKRFELSPGSIDNCEDSKNPPEKQWQNIQAHSAAEGKNERGESRSGGERPSRGRAPEGASVKKPVFGATVGMAINQTVAIMKPTRDEINSPDFWKEFHYCASQVIRVSMMLEEGRLAPKNKPAIDEARGNDLPPTQDSKDFAEEGAYEHAHEEMDRRPIQQPSLEDDDIPF